MADHDEICYNCQRPRREHSLGSVGWVCPTAVFTSYSKAAKAQQDRLAKAKEEFPWLKQEADNDADDT